MRFKVSNQVGGKMKTFDVQGVEISADFARAFDYIANPRKLPEWTNAFRSVSDGKAVLETPAGAAEIALDVRAFREHGTVDWIMRFPDQTVETAYSRLVSTGEGKCIFSFVLMAPKVPLEHLEGTLEQQSAILSRELTKLQQILNQS
jgi:hypothetical protein